MLEWLTILISLLATGIPCYSSVFGYPEDPNKSGYAVCLKRPIKKDEIGVAHRFLKCGTKIAILNPRTKRMALATVIDHGPYGAMYEGQWVLKRTKSDPGVWRGCLDITRQLQQVLEHNGFEKVLYKVIQ